MTSAARLRDLERTATALLETIRDLAHEDIEEGKPDLPAFLTITQAAAYLSVSRPTLYRLIGEGEIVPTRIGRRTRISAESITDYLARNTDQGGDRWQRRPGGIQHGAIRLGRPRGGAPTGDGHAT